MLRTNQNRSRYVIHLIFLVTRSCLYRSQPSITYLRGWLFDIVLGIASHLKFSGRRMKTAKSFRRTLELWSSRLKVSPTSIHLATLPSVTGLQHRIQKFPDDYSSVFIAHFEFPVNPDCTQLDR